jgi:glycosyltransferase involved in cell wall biosynthesis
MLQAEETTVRREAPSLGNEISSQRLRILLASAHDRKGGAAVAASRLRDGLLSLGHAPRMFVQTQSVQHPATCGPRTATERTINRLRSNIDGLALRRYNTQPELFSASWLPRRWPAMADAGPFDIVHLHWTNAGFLSVRDIGAIQVPVVWTLHDMWAFTGGCQYDAGCGRFAVGCGRCPVLGSGGDDDLSFRRFKAKRALWAALRLTIVCPSRWMASEAARSSIFAGREIVVLRNGLNLQRYKPIDRAFARSALGLPSHLRLVLFGALNPGGDQRKGYDLLQEAVGVLASSSDVSKQSNEAGLGLVVFGSENERQERLQGLPTWYLGHLTDDVSLALLYAACDVFVAPSRQENLANTVAEALACGTPCVAFNIGGMPDLIEHGENGFLAQPFDAADLARGITWCLERADGRWERLCDRARRFSIEHLDGVRQAQGYVEIYRQLLTRQSLS